MTRVRTAKVVVIGTGAAGLRAAIAAHEAGAEVVVIGKRARLDANTVLASGGINAALGSVDPVRPARRRAHGLRGRRSGALRRWPHPDMATQLVAAR